MTLRDTFTSKVAAAALVSGIALGTSAWAQEPAPQPASPQTQATLVKTTSWTVDPLIPVPLTAGLTLAFLAACGYAGMRRTRGTMPRVMAGLTVATALINPQLTQENRERVPTEVIIVVDKTASQSLQDRQQDTEKARAHITKELSGIKDIHIRTLDVGGAKEGVASDGSNLFTGLEEGLSDVPREHLGAVIMLTDGQVHDIPANYPSLTNGVPLHAIISGNPSEHDRRIVLKQSPRFGLVNKSQNITFTVVDDGKAPADKEKVRVSVSIEGKNLATQFVTPGQDVTMKIDIPHTGTNLIELKTDVVPGELTDVNNRAVASIEGIRENLNVLVVSGTPNAGSRTWDVFKADPDNNFVHFTALRPPSKQDDTPYEELALMPFPMEELFSNKINKFDLIIFDHFSNDGILPPAYFENIAKYVTEGGSLLVVAGPDYAGSESLYDTTLKAILPAAPTQSITEKSFVPKISKRGQRHPVTRGLGGADTDSPPWGQWFRVIDSASTSGEVVMEGADKKPLLILDRKSKGRVAMLMSDNSWLWEKGYDGGGPQAELIGRISQWLMKNPALEEEALRLRKENGNLVVEQQTMSDVSTPVTVRSPSGKNIPLTLERGGEGLWRSTLPSDELGLYSAEQGGKFPLKTFINIGALNPKEYTITISSNDILKPVVSGSGGKITRMNDAAGKFTLPKVKLLTPEKNQAMTGEDWIGVRMTQATILKGIDRMPVMPPWAATMMVIALLGAAFYREGETSLFRKNPLPKKDSQNSGPSL